MGFLDSTTSTDPTKKAAPVKSGGFLDSTVSDAAAATAYQTRAAKQVKIAADADQASADAEKANSFTSILKSTAQQIIPTVGNFIKTAVTNPKEAIAQTGQAILGGAEGVLNAVPYIADTGEVYTQADIDANPVLKVEGIKPGMKKSQIKIGDLGTQLDKSLWTTVAVNASKGALSDDQANSLYESYVAPYKTAREAGSFASMFVPYEAAENVAARGIAYAAPKFAENYKLATKILSSVVGFNAADQALAGPDTSAEDRLNKVLPDTVLGAAFPIAGALFKGASNLIFRPVKATEFAAKDATIEPIAAAEGSKPTAATPKAVVITPDGKVAMSTNDVDAVRGYIKDSGKTNIVIDEKPAGTLGLTKDGIPITANHEFNPKTGVHTITVTNLTDAESFAHEWGHYINDDTAKQVRGLSNYLFDNASTVKNTQGIEDTLRSLATRQLGEEGRTTITGDMIDRKITSLVTEMRSDVRQLAAVRAGEDARTGVSSARQYSEKFSDAVSTLLTKESAYRNTTLYKFLQEAGKVDGNLVRSMRAAGRGAEEDVQKTALDLAKERQAKATDEKLGMGDTIAPQPKRPGSKFELTTPQKEEIKFSKLAPKTVAVDEQGIKNVITKNKIPGKNLVEISISGKQPVTMVVHGIDRDIVRAIQLGADSKYMEYVKREVMNEYGISEKAAEKYISDRFNQLKGLARAQAEEGQRTLIKAIRSPEAEAKAEAPKEPPKPEEVAAEQQKASEDAANLDAAKQDASAEFQNDLSSGAKDKGFATGETVPSEPIGYGGEGEGPLRVNLDRMETGKVPNTDPFRAEKMASTQEDEVFLNTKVLPEMTGKFRVGRSNESIIQDAMRSDMTEDKFLGILKERVGALTPDVRAGFNIAMDKARGLQEMLGGRTAADLSPEELSSFKQQLGQTLQLFETYSGVRTEASNLLRSFGIAYEKGEDDVLRTIFSDLQKAGIASESDVFRAMANTYKTMNDNPIFKKYLKAWYAAVLSGPATTLRNTIGNISNVMTEIASAGINPARAKEVPSMISGFYRGLVEKGLPDAKEALKGEAGKFTTAYDPQFPLPEGAFKKEGMFDRITESVGRFLNAQDMAVSAGIREMEKSALKVYSPDVSDAVAKAISDQFGLSSVYRGLPKGRIMRGIVLGTETATREAPALKILIPFVRTIGNVIDRQFDYMPIFSTLRLSEKTLLDQASVIAKKYSISDEASVKLIMQRLKDQQMGRMYLGLATSAGAAVLAKQGLISGVGPSDYNEKVQLERTGWRPNSIKVGNMWVPYTYFGPLAGIFSLAGTMHDAVEYDNTPGTSMPALLGKGLIGWGQSELNSSFLKGTADLLNVLSGDTSPSKFFSSLGASLIPIPNLYTQSLGMAKTTYSYIVNDPSLRQQYETRGLVDAIRVKLGLTGGFMGLPALNPRTDMFGTPMTLDFIYGVSPTVDKTDSMPVDSLLINNGVTVTIPPKGQGFSFRGKIVKMTPDQYDDYAKTSGQMIYADLTRNYAHLKNLKVDALQKYVDNVVSNDRVKARNRILSGN